MPRPAIPAGWRELKTNENISLEDKVWPSYSGSDGMGFVSVSGAIGIPYSGYRENYLIIRKQTEPKPEKEWLNPWE